MKKNRAVIYLVMLVEITFCVQLQAQPVVHTQTTYYDVIAYSRENLVNALNSASPIKNTDRTFYGNTNAEITWRFLWESSTNNCRITRVDVMVNTIFTLPRLMKASNEVSQIWDKWYPHLIKHEKGHQKISIEIAEKIEEGIFNLPEYSSCEKLESQANSLGEKLIRKHDVMNKAFDGNTNHGETEGAWINPYL